MKRYLQFQYIHKRGVQPARRIELTGRKYRGSFHSDFKVIVSARKPIHCTMLDKVMEASSR